MNPITDPLPRIFQHLRTDIQNYFLHHAASLAYCWDGQEREKWGERDFHKKELSRLCGWGASEKKYDDQAFHLACVYLTRALGL